MNGKILLSFLSLIAITFLLSACSGRSLDASGWARITVDEETAYLAFNNHVHAINLANGTERWHYPAEADSNTTFYSSPAITPDGQLIVGGYDNVLYSLDPSNGGVNWTFEEAQNRYVAGPLANINGIFAPSSDKNLYSLDFSGERLWQPFETNEPIWSTPANDDECDCIYIASMDHNIYALGSQSGALIWMTEDLGGAIVGTPAVSDDDRLYIGTFANEMIAVDTDSGDILWRKPTEDWVWAGPAIDDEQLYFGDLSGTFYALDRVSGEANWNIQPGGSIVGTPLVTENGIYFTNEDGSIISVDREGNPRWTQTIDGNLHAGPVASGDLILVPTSIQESLLLAFDENGVHKWTFAFQE